MLKLVIDNPSLVKRIIRRRRATGADRFDEVWDGAYLMSPVADFEHQKLSTRLATAIDTVLGDREGVSVLGGGVNVTDRPRDWRKNYRVPDVAVFLPGNRAEIRKTHVFGGPDFVIEVLSKSDRSRDKFDFYAGVRVSAILLVDRRPWRLELHRLVDGRYELAGASDVPHPEPIPSDLLGLTFRIVPAKPRPQIEIACPADGRAWIA